MWDIQIFRDGLHMASSLKMLLSVSYCQGFYQEFYFIYILLSWLLLPIEILVGLDQIS